MLYRNYSTKKWIRIFVLLLLAVFLVSDSGAPIVSAASDAGEKPVFTDLAADSPLYPFARYLVEQGVMGGFPDGSFRPTQVVTRAQAARVMVQARGLPEVKDVKPTFRDVPSDHWAFGTIEAATGAGLLTGYPDGTFNPEGAINRAEAISMLVNLSGRAPSNTSMDISDVSPEHWAYSSVVTAVEAGLLRLSDDKLFNPDYQLNRGDLAKGVGVMFTLSPILRYTDLTGDLTVRKGKVTITKNGGVAREVSAGAEVGEGVSIATGEDSQAEITFDDGSGILLDANTEIEITKAEGFNYMRTDGSSGIAVEKLIMNLKRGGIFGALSSRHDGETPDNANGPTGEEGQETPWWKEPYDERVRVEVDMPWGVTGIRGTFWYNAVSQSGESSTSVIIGDAIVSSGGQTVPLAGGQTSTSSGGSAPSPPAPLSLLQRQAILQVQDWFTERTQEIQNNIPLVPTPAILPPGTPDVFLQQPQNIVTVVTQALSQATEGAGQTTPTGGDTIHHHHHRQNNRGQ